MKGTHDDARAEWARVLGVVSIGLGATSAALLRIGAGALAVVPVLAGLAIGVRAMVQGSKVVGGAGVAVCAVAMLVLAVLATMLVNV